MFRCFNCDYNYESNSQLISHVKSSHENSSYFLCLEGDCLKCYASLRTWMRHRYQIHKSSTTENSKNQTSENIELKADSINILEYDCSDSDSSEDDTEETLKDNCYENVKNNSFVDTAVLDFVAYLYSFPDVARKRVGDIVAESDKLIKILSENWIDVIKDNLLKNKIDEEIITELTETLKRNADPLLNFKTEYQRLKQLENHNNYICPESIIIGERKELKNVSGVSMLKKVPVSVQFISMRH